MILKIKYPPAVRGRHHPLKGDPAKAACFRKGGRLGYMNLSRILKMAERFSSNS
jgi:hypothetical protein